MAKNEQIEGLLRRVGLPVAYRQFVGYKTKPLPQPPYLIYLTPSAEARGADEKNLYTASVVRVELYSERSAPLLEGRLEEALDGFAWTKEESYIESERLWLVAYEFDLYEKI